MKNITQSLKVIALAILLSFGLSFVYAWTAPTVSAPGGNVSAPINTSGTTQTKAGLLVTDTLGVNSTLHGYANAYFGGNVGIGTASPTFARLVVESGSSQYNLDNGIISAQVSGTSKRVNVGYDTSIDAGYVQSVQSGTGNKPLLLNANGGNVGIGKANPNWELTVGSPSEGNAFGVSPSGDVIVTGGSDALWALYDKDMHGIMSWDANSDHMGIAGVSESGYTLRVHGSIGYDGGGLISDIRYKKNIEPIQNALGKILDLKGVTFDWNNEKYPKEQFKKGKDVGFVAQEVEKVLPEVVLTDSEGYKAIEYGNLSALLVEGMKEQQKEISELKAKNQELENKINGLIEKLGK